MCRAVQAKQEQERHGAEVHKEAESDDEAEEGKGAESKTDDASQQAAPAVADDAADEELDAELLAALGGQKSLPQGIMSEDELNRMVRCWICVLLWVRWRHRRTVSDCAVGVLVLYLL